MTSTRLPGPHCYLALWLLAWLCCTAGWTQASSPPPLSEYFRESWSTGDGLPHNLIADIAQTPEGYLWLATWEGAVRYSGRNRVVVDASVPLAAPGAPEAARSLSESEER